MTRPADIPEDVWQLAETALLQANTKAHMLAEPTDPLECISRAILADRASRPTARVGGLTAHQKSAFDFIASYIDQHGISPTYDEIAGHLGIVAKSAAHRVVRELIERGRIRRLPNRSRAITIIANPAN